MVCGCWCVCSEWARFVEWAVWCVFALTAFYDFTLCDTPHSVLGLCRRDHVKVAWIGDARSNRIKVNFGLFAVVTKITRSDNFWDCWVTNHWQDKGRRIVAVRSVRAIAVEDKPGFTTEVFVYKFVPSGVGSARSSYYERDISWTTKFIRPSVTVVICAVAELWFWCDFFLTCSPTAAFTRLYAILTAADISRGWWSCEARS